MLLAWLVFPLLLCLLCLGCGLLVQLLSGCDVPGSLLIPLGFALIVVAAQAMVWGPSPSLATPLVIALAVAGLRRRRLAPARVGRPTAGPPRPRPAVFAVFAAPVVLSGDATFAGYTVLGDTSIHFILVDRLMEHGRDLSGLPPSSYKAALDAYFDTAYPVGAHVALGAVRPLVGQDVAWVFQPFLAFLAAMLSLSLYSLLGGIVERRALRAAIALLAAQPALVYAYALQGSVKELATVAVVATLLALVPLTVREGGLRRLVPLAIASAAALAVLGPAVAPWLAPLLLACAVALAWSRRPHWFARTARDAGFMLALAGLLSLPVLTQAADFVRENDDTATSQTELGNLLGPLDRLQAVGIWLEGDYRLKLAGGMLTLSRVLIALALAAAVAGIVWAVRRRAWLPLLYLGISLLAWARRHLAGLALGRRQGADDRLSSDPAGVAAGSGGAGAGGEGSAGVVAGRRDRDRRRVVERARLPRRPPRAARPAGRAGRRGRAARGRRPDAVPGVRGVRQALPARRATDRLERAVGGSSRARRAGASASPATATRCRSRIWRASGRWCCGARPRPAARPRPSRSCREATTTRSGAPPGRLTSSTTFRSAEDFSPAPSQAAAG